jgi:glutamate synthase domain-containing protein 2
MTERQKRIMYQLLYVKYISALDYYIGQELREMILSSEDYVDKYLHRKRKQTPTVTESSWEKAQRRLERENFQNVDNVRDILSSVFNIEIAEHDDIKDAVKKRNRIIHHGSFDDNNPIKISEKDFTSLIESQRNYVRDIVDAKADIIVERLINNQDNNK